MTTFTEIVTLARQLAGTSGMTEAEFDYSLATEGHNPEDASAAMWNAAYYLANADLPEVDDTTTAENLRQREANAKALLSTVESDRVAMIAAAKAKSYTGWSDAARGQRKRIEYAR